MKLLQYRDIGRGYMGEPRHQQSPHHPAEHQTSVAPSTNCAHDSIQHRHAYINHQHKPLSDPRNNRTKAGDTQQELAVGYYARRQKVGPGTRLLQDTKAASPPRHARVCINRTCVRTITTNPLLVLRSRQQEPATPIKALSSMLRAASKSGAVEPWGRPLRVVNSLPVNAP